MSTKSKEAEARYYARVAKRLAWEQAQAVRDKIASEQQAARRAINHALAVTMMHNAALRPRARREVKS